MMDALIKIKDYLYELFVCSQGEIISFLLGFIYCFCMFCAFILNIAADFLTAIAQRIDQYRCQSSCSEF